VRCVQHAAPAVARVAGDADFIGTGRKKQMPTHGGVGIEDII
jgi:hypothetical protein